jgi:hypothetical protein
MRLFSSLICRFVLPSSFCYGIDEQQSIVQAGEDASLQNKLTFTGVSGRLSNREEAVTAALEDAARKLSFFYSVNGFIFSYEYHIGGTPYFETIYKLSYDSELDKFIKQLEYDPVTDVLKITTPCL